MPDVEKTQEYHAEAPDCVLLVVYGLLLLDCVWAVVLICFHFLIRHRFEFRQACGPGRHTGGPMRAAINLFA